MFYIGVEGKGGLDIMSKLSKKVMDDRFEKKKLR
jgi:hypothetical protein